MVQEAYSRALQLLKENRRALDRVAERLIEREAMDGGELDGILAAEGARMCPALRVAADPPPAPAGSGGDGNSSTVAR